MKHEDETEVFESTAEKEEGIYETEELDEDDDGVSAEESGFMSGYKKAGKKEKPDKCVDEDIEDIDGDY